MHYYNEYNNIAESNVTQFMKFSIGQQYITALNIKSINNAIRLVKQNYPAQMPPIRKHYQLNKSLHVHE